MIWRDVYIAGTGSFLPPRADIATIAATGTPRRFSAALGYRSVTVAEPDTGLQMATRAALAALQSSGYAAHSLSLITLASALPTNRTVLSPVCQIQRILQANRARALDLNTASAGDVAGLVAAAEHLTVYPDAEAVLAVAASSLTGTDRLHSPDHIMSDGACALVLARRPGRARLVATSHAAAAELEVLTHINLTPAARIDALKSLTRSQLSIMQGKTEEAVGLVLDEAGTSIDKLARVIVPGAGIPFLTAVIAQPLGIDLSITSWPFARHVGHAGPCDHVLALDHLLRCDPYLKAGDQVLIVGLGAGWRWICALIEILTPGEPQ